MSTLKPFADFPTPYGLTVPVYRPPEMKLSDPDAFVFSMDATAICAGIYDKGERARFVADATRLKVMPAFESYGGHTLPRVVLPRPADPLYPRMPAKDLTPIEAWVTAVLDRHRWCDRAEFFVDVIGENLEQFGADDRELKEFYPFSLSTMLTATLEHLFEPEIDCLEAAALYAVTMQSEFQEAGLEWLKPFRRTWFRDWVASRPRYAAFARALAGPLELPDWLCGFEGGRA